MDVTWSESGKSILTCSLDGSLVLRDVETGLKPIFSYRPAAAESSPFDDMLASFGDSHGGGFQRCASMPERPHLFLALDVAGSLVLVDDRAGRGKVGGLTPQTPFSAICPDGGINGFGIAAGDTAGAVSLWDLRQSTSSSAAATATATGAAASRRYEPARTGSLRVGKTGAPVTHVSWSHDTGDRGVIVTVSDDGGARVYREDTSRRGAKRGGANSVAATASGTTPAPRPSSSSPKASADATPNAAHRAAAAAASGFPSSAAEAVEQQQQGRSPTHRGVPSFAAGPSSVANERRFTYDTKATVSARSYPIRAAFRPGTRDVSLSLHARLQDDDDDDTDVRHRVRRVLGDDDLLACGGTDCVVRVFQREGAATEHAARRLESRRKRRLEQERTGEAREREAHHHHDAAKGTGRAAGAANDTESDAESDDDVNMDLDPAGDDAVGRLVQLQALEGHRDVVYGASFHRTEPVLASFSADATVRVWRSARAKQ
jgi:WD40 repeat protein